MKIEQIKCDEYDKSEDCDRIGMYCGYEVELYVKKLFEKFLDEAEELLCENLIFQKVEDIISNVLEDK